MTYNIILLSLRLMCCFFPDSGGRNITFGRGGVFYKFIEILIYGFLFLLY